MVKCAKLEQDWTNLIFNILSAPCSNFGWDQKKSLVGPLQNDKYQVFPNLGQSLHSLSKQVLMYILTY